MSDFQERIFGEMKNRYMCNMALIPIKYQPDRFENDRSGYCR